MTKYELKDLIESGREIEFDYMSKRFSITYWEDGENSISFCEFYKDPVAVKSFDELCNVEYNGEKLLSILAKLSKEDIWIF